MALLDSPKVVFETDRVEALKHGFIRVAGETFYFALGINTAFPMYELTLKGRWWVFLALKSNSALLFEYQVYTKINQSVMNK